MPRTTPPAGPSGLLNLLAEQEDDNYYDWLPQIRTATAQDSTHSNSADCRHDAKAGAATLETGRFCAAESSVEHEGTAAFQESWPSDDDRSWDELELQNAAAFAEACQQAHQPLPSSSSSRIGPLSRPEKGSNPFMRVPAAAFPQHSEHCAADSARPVQAPGPPLRAARRHGRRMQGAPQPQQHRKVLQRRSTDPPNKAVSLHAVTAVQAICSLTYGT